MARTLPHDRMIMNRRGDAATIALMVGCNAMGCNSYETLDVVKLRTH